MNRRIRTDPRAAQEFIAAADWYEGERSGLGREFEAAIHAAIADLASGLFSGSRVPGRGPEVRRLVLSRFPYDIVFLPRPDEIVIVAVAHQARRPGYWRNRLR